MSSFSRSSTRRGFTLIELLVVVSIISLLVAILLPSLQRARSAAFFTVCSANLKQFHLGFTYYANDNDDTTIPGFTWVTGLNRIIPMTSTCPFTRDSMDVRKVIDSYFDSPESWRCPGDRRSAVFDEKGGSSYAYDWYILSRKYKPIPPPQWTVDDVTSYKLSRFDRPAETNLFSHQWIYTGTTPVDYNEGMGIYWPHKYLDDGKQSTGYFFIYLDGHVSRKFTFGDAQQTATEITNYYLNRYPFYP